MSLPDYVISSTRRYGAYERPIRVPGRLWKRLLRVADREQAPPANQLTEPTVAMAFAKALRRGLSKGHTPPPVTLDGERVEAFHLRPPIPETDWTQDERGLIEAVLELCERGEVLVHPANPVTC